MASEVLEEALGGQEILRMGTDGRVEAAGGKRSVSKRTSATGRAVSIEISGPARDTQRHQLNSNSITCVSRLSKETTAHRRLPRMVPNLDERPFPIPSSAEFSPEPATVASAVAEKVGDWMSTIVTR